ncbi:hypothetical protein NQ176_g1283 [Zarea fungicola]|uniref:Uncharacterized protein n=1 Tax=Zarea fungicola TaxID=93591 RepID=A0ACC1NVR9_9HYPO|nr:hypothetical protein NQ176_g1283 [Lecanicillium fungicola]
MPKKNKKDVGIISNTAGQPHGKATHPEPSATSTTVPVHRKTRSQSSTLAQGSSPPTTPGRSQRRSGVVSDFDRGEAKNTAGRQLWSPPDEPKIRNSRPKASTHRRVRHGHRPSSVDQPDSAVHPADMSASPNFSLFRQPDTKPITQDQLINEVKGIYEGLRLVETKCIELNGTDTRIPAGQKLNIEQYHKLIGLHRTLLNEHHDFFLASQHPSANAALLALPQKYNMPARMWRHGIQSFLEFLRKRLPDSREYMLTFIYVAYSAMTLLYETVPGFIATWIECLGDLGRYRMAIEDDDIRDRETWTGVSRSWYSKASELLPDVGRLYHHLAILARPDALQQLYYYSKALCVPIAFPSARESIMTLFSPVLSSKSTRLDPCDAAFVRVHGILFSGNSRDQLKLSIEEFLDTIDRRIAETSKDWLHQGYYMAITLICSLMGYGATENPLALLLPVPPATQNSLPLSGKNAGPVIDKETASQTFKDAYSFAMQTCGTVLQRKTDANVLPFFHTLMVFLYYVAQHPKAMSLIDSKLPWNLIVDILNDAKPCLMSKPRMEMEGFPRPPPNEPLRPLPEDYAMRGLQLSADYFPKDWFSSDRLEEDEKMFELPSLGDERRQRVLWLARRISTLGKWMVWDKAADKFTVNPMYDNLNLPAGD